MQLKDLLPIGLLFVILAIALSVGADIVQEVHDDQVTDAGGGNSTSYASNVSSYGLESVSELGSWTPTIALVVAAAVVITVLIASFAFARF